MKRYFITGIGTDVGKTIAAAILAEALEADYWKPIQAGNLENTDSMKLSKLVSNSKSIIHPESYKLKLAMSPHAAAEHENIKISLTDIHLPKTQNYLVIEGAGGLLVPLNNHDTMIDLIDKIYCEVILVSKHYLGSINHTLMSIDILKRRNISIGGLLFNGNENKETESIIKNLTGIKVIGRINKLEQINSQSIKYETKYFKDSVR